MHDPAQLSALSAVIRLGAFDAAAHALGVTPSAISQRIKALEDRIGTTLIQRGTPCTATPTGARLARHYDDLTLLETALAADIGQTAAPARLRVAVNADSLATWFLPAIAGHPMLFDLLIDDQDHSADWLRKGEVSAAITGEAGPVQGCDSFALGALTYRATASPSFVRQHFPNGVTAEALATAPALTFNAKDALQNRWVEMMVGKRVPLNTHLVPSSSAFVEASLLGMGWGMNPAALVDGLIAEGKLVDLSPERPLLTPLHWQVNRLVAKPLAGLTASIRAAAKQTL